MDAEFVFKEELWSLAGKDGVLILPGHTIFSETAYRSLYEDWLRPYLKDDHGKFFWRLVAHEKGGGFTNEGFALIVCDLAGNPLRPVEIYNKGHLACKTHAKFVSTEPLIEVRARKEKREISCSVVLYELRHGVCLNGVILSMGVDPDNIPNNLKHLFAAIKAATEKISCYHCRHTHFADVKSESKSNPFAK